MTFPKPRRPDWPEITWTYSPDDPSGHGPRILGINPWIYDFAAYNLWSRPVGLLACLHMFRQAGCPIALLDCMDQTWADIPWPKQHVHGRGKYPREFQPPPQCLRHIPRRFARYGLPLEAVNRALQHFSPPPDAVFIGSSMTYRYLGIITVIEILRTLWPRVPIILGGVYATLCTRHSAGLEADLVIQGPLERADNWQAVWNLLGNSPPLQSPDAGFGLSLDLYSHADFAPVLGSRGCPFHCPYCASNTLYPGFRQSKFDKITALAQSQYDLGVRDFAFYDDALLVHPQTWLHEFLAWAEGKGIRLHTPNALHVRLLNSELCRRLVKAGLTTVRLGLETSDFDHRLDAKLSHAQWQRGLQNLFQAGIRPSQVKAYVLFGLPFQEPDEVLRTVNTAHKAGIRAELALYSPIPDSPLFAQACTASEYDLENEPLFHNNSIWPCVPGGYSPQSHRYWNSILADH